MKVVSWILVLLNAIACGVGLYVSMSSSGMSGSVRDVLQVLAGVGLLNAVAILFLLMRKGS